MEMHSLAAMSLVGGSDGWWLGGLIGKTIIGLHTLLAAALIGGFVARLSSRWLGWSAAGLWMAVPGNFNDACSGLIDSALGTYIVAGCIVATQLIQGINQSKEAPPKNEDSQDDQQAQSWMVFLLFLFAGFAAASKYTGLIYAVIPAIALVTWLAFQRSMSLEKRSWLIACFCGIAITCLPWYAKNLAFTGNPFYPLAYSVFGGKALDTDQAQQWSAAHRVPETISGESVYGPSALVKSIQRVTLFADAASPSLIVLGLLGWYFVLRK
jgi:4-amino-4-deoxy-L-arabinose transferase-like glycosyltransferase